MWKMRVIHLLTLFLLKAGFQPRVKVGQLKKNLWKINSWTSLF